MSHKYYVIHNDKQKNLNRLIVRWLGICYVQLIQKQTTQMKQQQCINNTVYDCIRKYKYPKFLAKKYISQNKKICKQEGRDGHGMLTLAVLTQCNNV